MAFTRIGFDDRPFNEQDWYAPVVNVEEQKHISQPNHLVHFEHDDSYYWAWIINLREAEVVRSEKFRDQQNLLKAYSWVDDCGMSNLMRVDYIKLYTTNGDRPN